MASGHGFKNDKDQKEGVSGSAVDARHQIKVSATTLGYSIDPQINTGAIRGTLQHQETAGFRHHPAPVARPESNMEVIQKKLDLPFESNVLELDMVHMKASTMSLYPSTQEKMCKNQAYLFLMQILMLNSNVYFNLFKNVNPPAQRGSSKTVNNQGNSDNDENRSLSFLLGTEEEPDEVIHPQDVAYLSLMACSASLRAHIYSKLFTCKLAVPFIVSSHDGGLLFFLNALRGIILQVFDGVTSEKSATDCMLHAVSFIRWSDNCVISKSRLINEIMAYAGTVHHTFYNRDCPSADKKRLVSNGIVEAAWYLPSPTRSESTALPPMAFLNLRGNAQTYRKIKLVSILGKISSTIVTFINIDDLAQKSFVDSYYLIQRESSPKKIFLLVLLPGIHDLREVGPLFLDNFNGQIPKEIEIIRAGNLDGSLKNASDLKEEIKHAIAQSLEHRTPDTWLQINHMSQKETLETIDQSFSIQFDQEIDSDIKIAQRATNDIFKRLGKYFHKEKSRYLPLLIFWEEWASWKKTSEQLIDVKDYNFKSERVKVDKGIKDPAEKWALPHMTRAEVHMSRRRRLQLENISNTGNLVMDSVSHYLMLFHKEAESRKVFTFVDMLRDQFDRKSREIFPKLNQAYKEISAKYKESEGNESVHKRLKEVEKNLMESSFSIHHIFREIGQIYEALISEEALSYPESREKYPDYLKYPEMAARLLLSGFPLELMDGDAGSIPMVWIDSLLQCLSDTLGRKKVLVISVLGVQSSGKSTLLNAMFGVQFAVSAGRCTRGVYMQLIRMSDGDMIHTETHQYFEYILILDSEGIRALEGSEVGIKRDNEIATLVIGLSDLTIMNIKGEQYTDVQDVIQIAVHAFLRMHLHNRARRCIFTHQNVSAPDAEDVLLSSTNLLTASLDKATCDAAKSEQRPDITRFNTIVQFDHLKQTFYFGDIWFGEQPMSPTDPAYHKKVLKVKRAIFECFQDVKKIRTVYGIMSNLQVLWKGIESEAFVFKFRNAEDIKAFTEVEARIQEHFVDMTTYVHTKCYQQVKQKFANCPISSLDNRERELLDYFETHIKETISKQEEDLYRYQKKSSRTSKYQFSRVGDPMSQEMDIVIGRMRKMVALLKERRFFDIMANEMNQFQRDVMLQSIKELVEKMRREGKQVTDPELKRSFDELWNRMVLPAVPLNTQDIIPDINQMLRRFMPSQYTLIQEQLALLPLNIPIPKIIVDLGKKVLENTKHGYIDKKVLSGFGKFKSKIRKMFKQISILEESESLSRQIERSVDELLYPKERYDQSVIQDILKLIELQFEDQNKKSDFPYTFTLKYKIRLIIQTLRFIVPKLENLEKNFDRREGFSSKREQKRLRLYNTFEHIARKRVIDEGFPGIVAYVLDEYLWERVITCTEEKIFQEISGQFTRKTQLLELFHRESALTCSRNMSAFIELLHSNLRNECIESLFRWIQMEYFQRSNPGDTKCARLLYPEILRLIRICSNCVYKVQLTGDHGGPRFYDWIKAYVYQLSLEDIHISETSYSHVDKSLIISNIHDFSRNTAHQTEALRTKTIDKVKRLDFENMISTRYAIAERMNDIWGCDALCPVCREPCYRGKNHQARGLQHFCLEHRPAGITGFVVGTIKKELAVLNCYQVTQASPFHKERLLDWEMNKKPYLSEYWLWFLVNHGKELAKHFGCDPPKLHPAWHRISLNEAFESLNTISHINVDQER